MNIVIGCGASGGHIFPGLALAQELLKNTKNSVLIVCSDRPIDAQILRVSGCEFVALPQNPFVRTRNPILLARFFIKLVGGIYSSLKILIKRRPCCVVGFGGFASGPVIFAAWCLRIPRIIHEQNLVAGLANRIESVFANRVAVSFEETKRFFKDESKVTTVGNPVRGSFVNLDKNRSRERFGLERERFTIFVMGGSQGASSINNAVVGAASGIDHMRKQRLQIIHVTGESDYEAVKKRYQKENVKSKVFPFLEEVDRAYAAADLVVARAGATTIAELTYFGRPSILIPYSAENVHQKENAYYLSKNNAAVTMEEESLNADGLKKIILNFLEDPDKLDKISKNSKRLGNPNAAKMLAEEVAALSGEPYVKE
ncbi:MAG: undecaprenyldiphospho-muramoylpentapeptide beta-N-acetylglucosaminyltransferase [Candidatus Omnitrophota bacterium]